MGIQTKQGQRLQQTAQPQKAFDSVTLGTVVDTNDPQQMGRVRAVCTAFGDAFDTPLEHIPWALYASPFAGYMNNSTRGAGIQETEGAMAYGMWFVPKIGSQVLIMCLDGSINQRVYLGSIFGHLTPHTMPHGRFFNEDHNSLEKTGSDAKPYGPYSTREKLIEPLATNLHKAFGDKSEPNYEWRTRAADYSASAVDIASLNQSMSLAPDDKDVIGPDGWNSRQGYGVNRFDPSDTDPQTGKVFDSHVHSITTPGFHAMSMDDRQENCRVRFRTTAGHQIIMDDTNERVYIQTAQGQNWIEMDQQGNIDIYTSKRVSVHAEKEINFTSDDTIRMHAAKGIHMYSGTEIRMQSVEDTHVTVGGNLRADVTAGTFLQTNTLDVKVGSTMKITTGGQSDIKVEAGLNVESTGTMNIKSNAELNLQATQAVNVKSDIAIVSVQSPVSINALAPIINLGGNVVIAGTISGGIGSGDAGAFHGNIKIEGTLELTTLLVNTIQSTTINADSVSAYALRSAFGGGTGSGAGHVSVSGPSVPTPPAPPGAGSAAPAAAASNPNQQPAFWTDRVPDHEPWARAMTKDDFTHQPELDYTDPNVGKLERGVAVQRGIFWRR